MMQIRSTQTTSPGEPTYRIRPAIERPVACAACGHEIAGGAPLGLRDEEPLCDRCLLESSPQLALILALTAFARSYALVKARTPEHGADALGELGYFSRVYERIAARSGPMRPFRIPDLPGEEARHADR